jgi:hypothetical protein
VRLAVQELTAQAQAQQAAQTQATVAAVQVELTQVLLAVQA